MNRYDMRSEYNPTACEDQVIPLEDPNGCWVRYEDVAALAAELSALCEFRDEVVGVMNNSQGVAGWHKNHTIATWDELFPVVPDVESPQHHLRELRAEAVLDFHHAWSQQTKVNSLAQFANQYANSIWQGGAK